MADRNALLLSVVNCTLRFRLKISFSMEISEILMERFTLSLVLPSV